MSGWLYVICVIGLVIWCGLAFAAARIVQLAGRHARFRDLRLPAVKETFGDANITYNKPISVTDPLTFIVSYAHAGLLLVFALVWAFSGQGRPLIVSGILSVVLAGIMVIWYTDYQTAMDERSKHLPSTHPVRIELVQPR